MVEGKTAVVGLGNPILGDDGIGWRVVEAVEPQLPPGVDTMTLALGGLSLMEQLIGYARIVLVDSIQTRDGVNGAVYTFPLSALPNPSTGHSTAIHDTSLQTALDLGRQLGAELPRQIDIVAVEAAQVYDFSDTLTPAVAAAIPEAAAAVLSLLNITGDGGDDPSVAAGA